MCLFVCFILFVFQQEAKSEEAIDVPYAMTPGIDVTKQSVSDAGKFVIWDCAGQQEYAITHGMFLGGLEHSIFLVLYDLAKQTSEVNQICFYILCVSKKQNKTTKT